MMRIQSACLEETLFFETRDDYNTYTARMDKRRIPYVIVSEKACEGDGVLVSLKKRYTHYDTGSYLQ